MKSRFAAFLCAMAVFQLMGGHWAVLQATAWVGMLVKYSEAEGVEVGITKTFDGKHPCDLCLSIAKNKQTEKKQSSQLDAAKIYLVGPRSALDAAASPLLLAFKRHSRFAGWLR